MQPVYLITGGAGNLACQLTFPLAELGIRCVLLDVVEEPVAPVAEGCEYVRGDVTIAADMKSLFRDYEPRVVVHFASLLSAASEANRAAAWALNATGAFTLLELALSHGVDRFFFPSSLAAYGGRLPDLIADDQVQWPDGMYGVTKATVERLGVYYARRHGLDFRGLRLPIVVSRYAHLGAASSYVSRAFMETARNGGFVFQVRPESQPALIYTRDVIDAVVMLLEAPAEKLQQRVYNIQALSPTAEELAAAIGVHYPDASLTFQTDHEVADLIDSWPRRFDDSAARRDWSWHSRYDLASMAADFAASLAAGDEEIA
ncbi:MAG: NAD-dependent epimerase/dehydratase family protein [Planctomycetota bacterium]|nr:NAD-dependent epimerase/dehydratase family protein [Planctomycetota bacterium]